MGLLRLILLGVLLAGWSVAVLTPANAQDTVAAKITGVIVTADSATPIAGVSVVAGGGLPVKTTTRTTSAADGHFALTGLAAGHYVVEFGLKGFLPGRVELDLLAGRVKELKLSLTPILPQVGELWGMVVCAGTALPIANAQVQIFDATDSIPTIVPLSATTDATGRFTLHNVPVGTHNVLVQHPEYVSQTRLIEIHEGLIATVQFELTANPHPLAPGTLALKVISAATQLPIKGASISISGLETFAPLLTNEQGELSQSLDVGIHLLTVGRDGFVTAEQKAEIRSGETTHLTVALKPKETLVPGAIEGVVLDAVTSQPLVGAKVYCVVAPVPGTNADASGAPQPATGRYVTTDATGAYRLGDLLPNSYTLYACAEGYYNLTATVQVLAGQTSPADFRLKLRVPMEACKISGTVSDLATGKPIVGAMVYYGPAGENSSVGWTDSPATGQTGVKTDANGVYTIGDLPPGLYYLLVRAEGYCPAHESVSAQPGQTADVSFKLTPWVAVVPGRIIGQVSDAQSGNPLAGAAIYFGPLIAANGTEWWSPLQKTAWPPVPAVRSDAQGHYAIENLAPGSYHLLARAEGHGDQVLSVDVVSSQTVTANFALAPIAPPKPGTIQGLVRDAGTKAALAGARVYYYHLLDALANLDERAMAGVSGSPLPNPGTDLPFVTTDAQGNYKLENLSPGQYTLMAVAEGYQMLGRILTLPDGGAIQAGFDLKPSIVVEGKGSIAGTVIDALTTGTLAGVKLWVTPTGQNSINGCASAVVLGMAKTDAQGHYMIENVPAGTVRVFASKDGYRVASLEVKVAPTQTTPADFQLQPLPVLAAGELSGTVRAADTEQPLAEAFITLVPEDSLKFALAQPPDFLRSTLTDQNGQFILHEVPAGTYHVIAVRKNYEPADQTVTIAAGVNTADFLLKPLAQPEFGALSGQVSDGVTSAPLAGALVQAVSNDRDWLANHDGLVTRTDAQGAFAFPRLAPGKYVVGVTLPGYEPGKQEVDVAAGVQATCTLALAPVKGSGAVEGTITDKATGQPLGGVRVFVPMLVQAYSANPENAPSALTGADGKYRIEAIAPGQRTVVAFLKEYFPDSQLVSVAADQTTALDFALLPRPAETQTWTVIARDAKTGKPLAGVRIHIPATDWFAPGSAWDPWSGLTDSSGVTIIPGVPTGEWTVVGAAGGYKPELKPLQNTSLAEASAGLRLASVAGPTVTLLFEADSSAGNAAHTWSMYQ